MLIEKPAAYISVQVATSATGIVTSGMMLARSECRNTKITSATSTTASAIVV